MLLSFLFKASQPGSNDRCVHIRRSSLRTSEVKLQRTQRSFVGYYDLLIFVLHLLGYNKSSTRQPERLSNLGQLIA